MSIQGVQEQLEAANGKGAKYFISDTDAHALDLSFIEVLVAAKFHTLTTSDINDDEALSTAELADTTEGDTIELPAGTVIRANISAVQLHSGAIMGYV